MSKMKDKYFDEINTGMEKSRLEKTLTILPTNDVSPVYIINKIIELNNFRLTEKEITEVVRNFYKF